MERVKCVIYTSTDTMRFKTTARSIDDALEKLYTMMVEKGIISKKGE